MICVGISRNIPAAEKTLQKALEAVKGDSASSVRPQFRCRLAGTLADIVARSEQEKPSGRGQDRHLEVMDLLKLSFGARSWLTYNVLKLLVL